MHLLPYPRAKHLSESKPKTASSLPLKKNSPPLSWMNLLMRKHKSLPNTLEPYIPDQALTSVSWLKSPENLSKLTLSNIMNQWPFKLFADKLLNSFNKKHKQVDTDLLESQSQLLVMMKKVLIWSKSIHLEPFITGKLQPQERTLKTRRSSLKKDTNLKCKSKMLFTQL